MADTDQSLYTLRFNQVANALEGFGGGSPQWTQVTITNTDPTQVPVTRLINTTAPLMGGGNLSADRTLSMSAATSLADGYLLHTDWATFNAKQPAGSYITALTGDATATGPGSSALTLATINANVGSFTVANITVNAKGLITAASSTAAGTSGFVLTSTGSAFVSKPSGIGNVGTITGTGTVTADASTANTFATTVTGALTLNGPSNGVDGQKVTYRILNDASHSVTLATGAGNHRFGTDIPSYTNSVSKTDYIGVIWNSAAGLWDVVSIVKGF